MEKSRLGRAPPAWRRQPARSASPGSGASGAVVPGGAAPSCPLSHVRVRSSQLQFGGRLSVRRKFSLLFWCKWLLSFFRGKVAVTMHRLQPGHSRERASAGPATVALSPRGGRRRNSLAAVTAPRGAHGCAGSGLPEGRGGGRLVFLPAEHAFGHRPEHSASDPCGLCFGRGRSAWPAVLTFPERGPGVSNDENN